jgi:hypothetical protein
MDAIGYLRASTGEHVEASASLDAQREVIMARVDRRGRWHSRCDTHSAVRLGHPEERTP